MALKYPFNRQTDLGEGVVFDENTGILSGPENPAVTDITQGVSIPLSTLYIRVGTTELYQKTGTNATDWTLLVFAAAFSRTAVTTSSYTIDKDDSFIGVDTSTTSITLTLPDGSTVALGKIFTIKDEGSNASNFAVIINTSGTDTIEGGETSVKVKIKDFSVDVQWTGNEWSIV